MQSDSVNIAAANSGLNFNSTAADNASAFASHLQDMYGLPGKILKGSPICS